MKAVEKTSAGWRVSAQLAPADARIRAAALALLIGALTASASRYEWLATGGAAASMPLAIGVLLTSWKHRVVPRIQLPLVARLLIVWCALALMSITWSIAPTTSFVQASAFVVLAAIVAASSVGIWRTEEAIARDFRAIFWPLWISCFVSLPLPAEVQGRGIGVFANANMLGNVSAIVAVASLSPWLCMRRWTRIPIFCTVTFTALMSESRTALLVILVSGVLALFDQLGPKRVATLCFCGAGTVLVILTNVRFPIPETVTRFGANASGTPLGGREDAWALSLDLWRDRPWLGWGFRAGEAAFQSVRTRGSFQLDGAHSSYLQVLLEQGVVGALLGALILISVVFSVIAAFARKDVAAQRLALVPVAGLMMGSTESLLVGLGQSVSWTFWLTVVMLAALQRSRSPQAPALVMRSISMGERH